MDHILVLEDEATLRNSFVRRLQERGNLEITAVGLLREAIASLDRKPPQLVIVDLDLPDGSGIDLLPELSLRRLGIPVVIVTAHLKRFQLQLPESPNIVILAKPFDPAYLVELVAERLARSKSDVAPNSSAFSVADYLQLAGMARRSLLLEVSRGGNTLGQIAVIEGQPRFAADAAGEGEPAFRRLALLQRCNITCQPLTGGVPRINLNGSLEHLLIDAARESDEALRAAARSEASQSVVTVNPTSSGQQAVTAVPPPLPPPARPRPAPLPPPRPLQSSAQQPSVSIPQEKSVNASKASNVSLAQVISGDSTLEAAARADRHGSVLEVVGKLDAETACAVALMAAREVAEAASELGFSRPMSFHVSSAESSWFIVQRKDEFVLARSAANKNPAAALRKLAKMCGAQS